MVGLGFGGFPASCCPHSTQVSMETTWPLPTPSALLPPLPPLPAVHIFLRLPLPLLLSLLLTPTFLSPGLRWALKAGIRLAGFGGLPLTLRLEPCTIVSGPICQCGHLASSISSSLSVGNAAEAPTPLPKAPALSWTVTILF